MSTSPAILRVVSQIEGTFARYFPSLTTYAHNNQIAPDPVTPHNIRFAYTQLNSQTERIDLWLKRGNIESALERQEHARVWWGISREVAYLYGFNALAQHPSFWRHTDKWRGERVADYSRWLRGTSELAVIYVAYELLRHNRAQIALGVLEQITPNHELTSELTSLLEQRLAYYLRLLRQAQNNAALSLTHLSLPWPLPDETVHHIHQAADQASGIFIADDTALATTLRTCGRLIVHREMTIAELLTRPLSNRTLHRLATRRR